MNVGFLISKFTTSRLAQKRVSSCKKKIDSLLYVRFLGEVMARQSCLEINWPLVAETESSYMFFSNQSKVHIG